MATAKYRVIKIKAYEIEEGDVVLYNNEKHIITAIYENQNNKGKYIQFENSNVAFLNCFDKIEIAIPVY